MLQSQERVAILAVTSGRRGDTVVTNEFVQVVRLSDGLVAEVRNFMWDPQALIAALSA